MGKAAHAENVGQIRDEFVARMARLQAEGGAIDRAGLAGELIAQGVSRATAYRWIDKALGGPVPEVAAQRKARNRAAIDRGRALDPNDDTTIVSPAEPLEPEIITPEMQATLEESAEAMRTLIAVRTEGRLGTVPVMDNIQRCLEIAERLERHALNDAGEIRNTKLLLAASEHRRRATQTAAQLMQLMVDVAEAEGFNREILELVRKFCERAPAIGADLVRELDGIATRWGAA